MSDTAERFRREGQADAIVLLVARRFAPHLDLEDFARALGITQPECLDAIARYRQRCRQDPSHIPSPPIKVIRATFKAEQRAARDAEIIARCAAGEPKSVVASAYGLSYQRVHDIVGAAS